MADREEKKRRQDLDTFREDIENLERSLYGNLNRTYKLESLHHRIEELEERRKSDQPNDIDSEIDKLYREKESIFKEIRIDLKKSVKISGPMKENFDKFDEKDDGSRDPETIDIDKPGIKNTTVNVGLISIAVISTIQVSLNIMDNIPDNRLALIFLILGISISIIVIFYLILSKVGFKNNIICNGNSPTISIEAYATRKVIIAYMIGIIFMLMSQIIEKLF